jgi:hypothetical protein
MTKKKETDYKKVIIYGAIITVIVMWIISWISIDYLIVPKTEIENPNLLSERGAFGDKFGFINSLFSGLALTGIIISIYFQQKELSLQRDELVETREEFKDQNFQTTFFNLLKTQRQLAEEIITDVCDLKSYDKFKKRELNGRLFFNQSKFELDRITTSLKADKYNSFSEWVEDMEYYHSPTNEYEAEDLTQSRRLSYTLKFYNISKETWDKSKKLNEIEIARISYGIFFNKYHFVMGHYFRHLYHILKFLAKKEIERKINKDENEKKEIKAEFQTYANFIQAQMTTPELFLLFYNSLSFPKLQKLLIQYNILENLTIEDLIEKEHNCIKGINLKSRTELLK